MIDPRDLRRELHDLEHDRDLYMEDVDDAREALDDDSGNDELADDHAAAIQALLDWREDNEERLEALRAVLDECDIDEPLIPEGEFEDYARDLADVPSGWPFDCIDWSEAAEALQQDYTSISFDGEDYWQRQ